MIKLQWGLSVYIPWQQFDISVHVLQGCAYVVITELYYQGRMVVMAELVSLN